MITLILLFNFFSSVSLVRRQHKAWYLKRCSDGRLVNTLG
jgi:hypothetical protein